MGLGYEEILWGLSIAISLGMLHFKNKNYILLSNVALCLVMSASMALIAAWSAVIINIISILWVGKCLLYPHISKSQNMVGLCAALALAALISLNGFTDLLPLFAFALSRYGESQNTTDKVQYYYLAGTSCWLAYAVCIESGQCLVINMLCLLSGVWAVYRMNPAVKSFVNQLVMRFGLVPARA